VEGKPKIGIAILGLFITLVLSYNALISYEQTCGCGRYFRPESVVAELNGRENLRWAQIKIGPIEFQTDDDLDREIVYGKTGGGWNVDAFGSENYDWDCDWRMDSPTQEGGKFICKSDDIYILIRKKAAFDSPAKWVYMGTK